MLKLEKRITLHTFDVEYIDQREPKPRAVHHELCVLDGKFVNPLPNLPPVPDFAEAVAKSKADAARLHEIAAELAAKSAQLERSAKA